LRGFVFSVSQVRSFVLSVTLESRPKRANQLHQGRQIVRIEVEKNIWGTRAKTKEGILVRGKEEIKQKLLVARLGTISSRTDREGREVRG